MVIKVNYTNVNYTKGRIRKIQGLVLHSMWGYYGGSISWFKNPKAKTSAHYLISEKGEITQMVRDVDTAWHAGIYDKGKVPSWVIPNPNWSTIGIELEDMRNRNWGYPLAQWEALIWLVKRLQKKYRFPNSHILLHKLLNPSRRTDPVGKFSLSKLLKDIKEDDMIDSDYKINLLSTFGFFINRATPSLKTYKGKDVWKTIKEWITSSASWRARRDVYTTKYPKAVIEITNLKKTLDKRDADIIKVVDDRDKVRDKLVLLKREVQILTDELKNHSDASDRLKASQKPVEKDIFDRFSDFLRKLFKKGGDK